MFQNPYGPCLFEVAYRRYCAERFDTFHKKLKKTKQKKTKKPDSDKGSVVRSCKTNFRSNILFYSFFFPFFF